MEAREFLPRARTGWICDLPKHRLIILNPGTVCALTTSTSFCTRHRLLKCAGMFEMCQICRRLARRMANYFSRLPAECACGSAGFFVMGRPPARLVLVCFPGIDKHEQSLVRPLALHRSWNCLCSCVWRRWPSLLFRYGLQACKLRLLQACFMPLVLLALQPRSHEWQ